MQKIKKIPSSFRDPDGYVFSNESSIYRCITRNYQENYEYLISSGLYKALTSENMLISHREIDDINIFPKDAYKVIQPDLIPFISYPYEWCFSQLKQAALTTLKIQETAIKFNMSLKDCSAYNMQFLHKHAVLIDTLSFEKYQENHPWQAYKQFCQHFLAPLTLMSHKDARLNQLLKTFIDGIPLDLASALLPKSTYLNFTLYLHIHLHAKFQKKFSDSKAASPFKANRHGLLGIIGQLESLVKSLKFRTKRNSWDKYYQDNSYSNTAFEHKKKIVSKFLDIIKPETIWDLGANKGIFSSIAGKNGSTVIAFDNEPGIIEEIYLNCKKTSNQNILPLVLDLTNPSPDIGWENKERISLIKRGPVHMIMALAIIHHLVISNNVPLERIAAFFANICSGWAIIEFVPKTDVQAKRLLRDRKDIFSDYTKEKFEESFSEFFRINAQIKIKESERIVYLMEKLR